MLATDNFSMRISPQEKAMLADVAKHFQRSQADTIRALVREVYELMNAEQSSKTAASDPKKRGNYAHA
jgi:propanediol dehydratase small subunit